MITQSTAAQSNALAPTPAAASIPASRVFYWSLRRELWEYRSLYLAPLAMAGIVLLGFIIATFGRSFSTHDLALRRAILTEATDFPALLIMALTFLIAVFYCLDTLHSERRDRSILFWKSLPVSDLITVLSKATVPVLVLPLITFAITFVMQCIMLLLRTAALLGSGLGLANIWSQSFQLSFALLFHLVAIHGFWYAPFYGWFLFVSAWARRAALLWATLPLLAIGVFEKIVFHTTYFAQLVGGRLGGNEDVASKADKMSMGPMSLMPAADFLFNPRLWIGLIITAAFLAAAVRLRRNREPI